MQAHSDERVHGAQRVIGQQHAEELRCLTKRIVAPTDGAAEVVLLQLGALPAPLILAAHGASSVELDGELVLR